MKHKKCLLITTGMSDIELSDPLLTHNKHLTKCPFDAIFSAERVPIIRISVPKIFFQILNYHEKHIIFPAPSS